MVTGGAGFIGSELVRQLVKAGAEVRVVDNLVNGRRANLEGMEGPGKMELIEADIRDQEIWQTIQKVGAILRRRAG